MAKDHENKKGRKPLRVTAFLLFKTLGESLRFAYMVRTEGAPQFFYCLDSKAVIFQFLETVLDAVLIGEPWARV